MSAPQSGDNYAVERTSTSGCGNYTGRYETLRTPGPCLEKSRHGQAVEVAAGRLAKYPKKKKKTVVSQSIFNEGFPQNFAPRAFEELEACQYLLLQTMNDYIEQCETLPNHGRHVLSELHTLPMQWINTV